MDQTEHHRADTRARVLDAVRSSGARKVKVAVADVDGVLRGKYVHIDKFFAAVDGGIGFSVFGTDLNDRPYGEGYASGRRLGFPDATVELERGRVRRFDLSVSRLHDFHDSPAFPSRPVAASPRVARGLPNRWGSA